MKNFVSGRRNFLKTVTMFGAVFSITNPLLAAAQSPANKMLAIYFSHSGNTRSVAREIRQFTNAEMCKILPTKPYPENHNALTELAEKQTAENCRPQFTINKFFLHSSEYRRKKALQLLYWEMSPFTSLLSL